MSVSSEGEDYHSADERRGEDGAVDTAQLSRDLEEPTTSSEVHVEGDVEKEKTPELLTEEEIQVDRRLTVTLCHCSVSRVRGRSEREKQGS